MLNDQQKNTIEKNLLKKIDIDKIISRMHPVESYDDLAQCGIIIEAVFERQDIKNDLFRLQCGHTVILLTDIGVNGVRIY